MVPKIWKVSTTKIFNEFESKEKMYLWSAVWSLLAFKLAFQVFWHFSSTLKPRTLCSGFMQQMFHSSNDIHYNKSDMILLSITDLQPTNLTCIYSMLKFIQRQADQINIKTRLVTFNQLLWYKTQGIIVDKNLNIVCHLGGFYNLMSFMSSTGYIWWVDLVWKKSGDKCMQKIQSLIWKKGAID